MKLNVFDREKWDIQVDSSRLDVTKHLNRHTHKEFTKEDLENFWIKIETKETKKTK